MQNPESLSVTRTPKSNNSNLYIVGTVATVGLVASIMLYSSSQLPEAVGGGRFLSDARYSEKQYAFMQFLVRYGRSYASKD